MRALVDLPLARGDRGAVRIDRRPSPIPGATTGITMNPMNTRDMPSAMPRPEKRSRTTAVATTRVAEAPSPWTKRRASSTAKLGARAAANTAAT